MGRGILFSVYDLTPEEMQELKCYYFDQLREIGEAKFLDDPFDIPDDVITHHYEDVIFRDMDFCCNDLKNGIGLSTDTQIALGIRRGNREDTKYWKKIKQEA